MIRIYDYVAYKQPEILDLLRKRYPLRRPAPLTAVWVDGVPFEQWRALMQEAPKSGIGGLLPGEKAEVVNL